MSGRAGANGAAASGASGEEREAGGQVTLARPVFAALAVADLVWVRPAPLDNLSLALAVAYLVMGTALLWERRRSGWGGWRLPVSADVVFLLVFVAVTPSVVAFWFLYLFAVFGAAMRWGGERALGLAAGACLALAVRVVLRPPAEWPAPAGWSEFAAWAALLGTLLAGTGISFLGDRLRRLGAEHELLARLAGQLRVEQGVAESLRGVLTALCEVFGCERALLAIRDDELERVFVWKAQAGQQERAAVETQPLIKQDSYLLDAPEVNVGWNSFEAAGDGFGWDRRDGRAPAELPRLPGPSRKELGLRSVLAVAFEFDSGRTARLLLGNGEQRFHREDLRRLERIAADLRPSLQNLMLLRTLRARAIEGERGRIAHDLHDGILQTLLSMQMQLEVLRRKVPRAPEAAAEELEALRQTLIHETEELRRMVTGLRPVQVDSADLADLLQGFAERFRKETGIGVELFVDAESLRMSPRLCREVFQICREALHNVKKHAGATHVVVKLWQDEERTTLVVDDNGKGFSFAGRFTSEELDRLRLGPISIKERTRGVGGVLTVESTPGHGARLLVEIPAH